MYEVIVNKKVRAFVEKRQNCDLLKFKIKALKYFKTNNLDLDVKKLQGKLKKYYRLRVGDVRILFYEHNQYLIVSRIDFRGKVYK